MESLTKKAFLEEDIADLRKEEEEEILIEMEEREKQDDEKTSAKGERKREREARKTSDSKLPTKKGTEWDDDIELLV